LESGPSNTVGFTKKACPGGNTYTDFGLPFEFWDVVSGVPSYGVSSTCPSDLLGSQLTGGLPFLADEVIRQDNGWSAYRGLTGTWAGTLEDNCGMDAGYGYWLHNRQASVLNLVLAGQVDTTDFGPIAVSAGEYFTPVSVRDARVVPVGNINLVGSGFTGAALPFLSDEVIEQSSGAAAWYSTTLGVWQTGGLAVVTPMETYWIHTRAGHPAFNWSYGPGAVAPPPERPGHDNNSINRTPTRPTRRARSVR